MLKCPSAQSFTAGAREGIQVGNAKAGGFITIKGAGGRLVKSTWYRKRGASTAAMKGDSAVQGKEKGRTRRAGETPEAATGAAK